MTAVDIGNSAAAFFGHSGLPNHDPLEGRMLDYAARLLRYIASDSTVRARTLEAFGRAPTLADLAAMRAAHRRRLALAGQRHASPDPRDTDVLHWQPAPSAELAEDLRRARAKLTGRVRGGDAPTARAPVDGARSWRDVAAAVAHCHGLTLEDMTSPSRIKPIVRVRNLLCAVLVARGASRATVGRWLGGRDHSSVVHALRQFRDRDIADGEIAATWGVFCPGVDPVTLAWL